jgi:N-acetylglucosaminyldiphosphoundecaprenol N-acetyl-beta-D-mannosaminyltransferase
VGWEEQVFLLVLIRNNQKGENGLEKFDILGVKVSVVDRVRLLALAGETCQDITPRFFAYVNAHCLNIAQGDWELKDILNKADLVYADGVGVVAAARWLGGPRLEKITGRDWINQYCKVASECGMKTYIVAGKPGVARRACQRMEEQYPKLKIIGCSDGYFFEKSEKAVLDEIRELRPDVVMIGMGVPRQEKWVNHWRTHLPVPLFWTVGALFDYVAGVELPVPALLNRLGLEWLWRLGIDPLGKWRRYIIGLPLFVFRVIRQKTTILRRDGRIFYHLV